MKKLLIVLVIAMTTAFLTSSLQAAKTTFVTIGTGGVTGIYYPTGGAIAKMINKQRKTYGIRASVESTAGSVYNINAILSGDLELAIAQSDRQYQAVNGISEWKKLGPQKKLRAICSFHPEVITLVAATDAKILSVADLRKKRVNIGNPGSGQRGNAIDILRTAGINWKKDIRAEALKPTEASKMLQDNRIDAFFYTIGHPSGAITEATAGTRKVRFVPITGMRALLKKAPYYTKTMMPVDLYPQAINKGDIPSIGVTATFVTSASVPEKVVYALTKEIFDNLETFKKIHPAFARLKKEEMLQGLTAPFHKGALRYYKEVGLIK